MGRDCIAFVNVNTMQQNQEFNLVFYYTIKENSTVGPNARETSTMITTIMQIFELIILQHTKMRKKMGWWNVLQQNRTGARNSVIHYLFLL